MQKGWILALAAAGLAAPHGAQSIGMVTDLFDSSVTVFDAETDTVLGTVSFPGGLIADCAITGDLTLGFVTNFQNSIWVIDLTTTPPTLADGINPIPISNPGEDLSITPDQRYLLACDGGATAPVSVVDIATRTEIDTLSLGACNSIDACSNGSVLVTDVSSGLLSRLTVDDMGMLTDTGEQLFTGGTGSSQGPNNVNCAPGGMSGVVIQRATHQIRSFQIPGLPLVDTRTLTADGFGISMAFSPAGNRLYARANAILVGGTIDVFDFDPATGALGAAPLFSIPTTSTGTAFGADQIAVHPDGSKLYVSETTLTGSVAVYDAATGDPITSITDPELLQPLGVCVVSLAECFLVIGDGPGTATFSAGGHTWPTLVSNVSTSYPVTLLDSPSFEIPVPAHPKKLRRSSGDSGPKKLRRAPEALGGFAVQVLMWNPSVFPGNPEQWTGALQVTLWSDGSATAVPYGTSDGMEIVLEVVEANGTRYVRFPFTIVGL